MTKTIVVAGFGPGISKSVALRFGREGHRVALVGRTPDRLAAGVAELAAADVQAQAFTADLGRPEEIRATFDAIRAALGPIAVLQWSAYAGGAGDLTTATPADLDGVLSVAVTGLVTAVQAALPDLRAQRGGVLVTNGGLGFIDPKLDAMGVQWNVMGLSVANAAKRKIVALLANKLAPDVYVSEIVVTGTVKGTAFDHGNGTLDPNDIAEKFWTMYQSRTETSVTM